ncbi:MAG: hypothetical protein OXG36_04680 [Caldilineaceae bacterium]|nr:hypothetical protein [Caldilineaceae bacterium]
MPPGQPRRIALLSFAYAAVLALQVGSRLLSGRDQDTVEAMYAAIAAQTTWHAVYALSVMAPAVLLVAVVANWNRWRATQPALLGRMAFWIALAGGVCWLVGGLAAVLQTWAALTRMTGNLGPLSPADLEEARAVCGKLGMSLAGAAILLVGAGTRLAGPAGLVMVLAAAASGVAALGIWWEDLPFHRLLGVLYLGWFVASGLILPRYSRSAPNPA